MSKFLQNLKEIVNFSRDIDMDAAKNYITSSIEFKGSNVWILIFAVIIASVGLNVNSIPVVIGAMLISPLMGPIMGIGLALGINDTDLLKRSFKNLLIMTFVSLVTASVYFLITPLALETPTELLARTNPTIYDVFIAFFGGLAVIVEVCRKEKGTVIAGAAIATALMPPLSTAGFGVASGNISYFIGAVYLYFINSLFIALATFLMVRYLKFPLVKISDPVKAKRVHRIITVFTVVMILPSIYSAITVIQENRFNKEAKKFVTENKNIGNSYIYDYKIVHSARKSLLTVSVAGEALSQTDLDNLNNRLKAYDIKPDEFMINQSSTFTPESINEKAFVESIYEQNENEIRKREKYIAEMEARLKEYQKKEYPSSQIAKELKSQYSQVVSLTLAQGSSVSIAAEDSNDGGDESETAIAIITASEPLTDNEMEKVKSWLLIRLSIDNLIVIQKQETPR